LATLRPGASEDTLRAAEQAIGAPPFPPALKAIYRQVWCFCIPSVGPKETCSLPCVLGGLMERGVKQNQAMLGLCVGAGGGGTR